MRKVSAALLTVCLAASMAPGIALAGGLTSVIGTGDAASQKEAPQEVKLEDVLPKVLEALGGGVYAETLQALQGGEVISQGTQSQAAAGLQQTLVDFGYGIGVDGDAGPITFGALNQLLGALGMGAVESVNADLYAQLLPPLLIARDEAVAADVLSGYYAGAEESSQFDYVRGCVLYAQERYFSAKEAFEQSGYGDYEQRAAACQQPWPENGELWHNDGMYYQGMSLTFSVNSRDESRGRYFEVFAESGELAATLFVTGSGSVTTWLPGGNYRIWDASGNAWYGMKDAFGRDGYYEFMKFWEFDGDEYLTALPGGYEWTISINSTEGSGTSVGSTSYDWEARSGR